MSDKDIKKVKTKINTKTDKVTKQKPVKKRKFQSTAKPKAKKIKTTKKIIVLTTDEPEKESILKPMAVRTRLYSVQDKESMFVRNKEGLNFHIPKNDVFWIGEFDSKKQVNKTEMINIVMDNREFTYIEFKKVDGDLREMFCFITRIHGNDVFLHDLEKPQIDSGRRCKLENIEKIISRKVMYFR